MIDAGGEVDFRGLEGVVGREVNCEEEDAAGVWRVAGTHDGGLPVELRHTVSLHDFTIPSLPPAGVRGKHEAAGVKTHEIIAYRACTTGRRWIAPQVCEFLVDTLQRHRDDMWLLFG